MDQQKRLPHSANRKESARGSPLLFDPVALLQHPIDIYAISLGGIADEHMGYKMIPIHLYSVH